MSNDNQITSSELLCPEEDFHLKIQDIRQYEGVFDRFVCENSSVVIYIPMRACREFKKCITTDYETNLIDNIFKCYIITESSNKKEQPSKFDIFVTKNPNETFRIVRANRNNKGIQKLGLGHIKSTRHVTPQKKSFQMNEYEPYDNLLGTETDKSENFRILSSKNDVFEVNLLPMFFRDSASLIPTNSTKMPRIVKSTVNQSEAGAMYGFTGVGRCALRFL
jgi:hypothetical protein